MIQNEIVDQFREETLHKQSLRKYAERIVRSVEPDPSTSVLESERSNLLRQAIESLSPIERDLVDSFHLGEVSIEQLAEKHNQTPSWVTTRLFRARAKLRTYLKNKI